MRKKIFNWKKGAGSELITIGITICALAFLGYIVVLYGGIYSEIQSQILADIVADGSVAYAKTNMNVAEVPLRNMAKKIFNANVGLNGDVTLIDMNIAEDIKITPVSDLPQNAEFMSQAENQYLKPRSQVMNGVLSTYEFKQTDLSCFQELAQSSNPSAQYKDISDLTDGVEDSSYPVSYNGPKYLDEIVTVTVSSEFDLPLLKGLTRKTKTAVELHTALVPYNSRASAAASGERNKLMQAIEEKAFEESTISDSQKIFSSVPKYGSIQQKLLLEARRYLGDGYERSTPKALTSNEYWPTIASKIVLGSTRVTAADEAAETNTSTAFSGHNADNRYKDCMAFVNVCFNFDNTGGISAALNKYPHKTFTRSIEYDRTVSSETIWEEMHPEQFVYPKNTLYDVKDKDHAEGKNYMVGAPYGYWWTNYEKVKNTESQIVILRRINGQPYEVLYSKADGYTLVETSDSYIVQTAPVVTLYEEILKYANPGISTIIGGGSSHIWEVTSADPWTDDMLQVGDVLIFNNPNRCDFVLPELIKLANAESKDEIDFGQFEHPDKYTCHYAIYFGEYGGKKCVLDCGNGTKDMEAVSIGELFGVSAPEGTSGPVLAQIIRFTDNTFDTEYNYDSVELPPMD